MTLHTDKGLKSKKNSSEKSLYISQGYRFKKEFEIKAKNCLA